MSEYGIVKAKCKVTNAKESLYEKEIKKAD